MQINRISSMLFCSLVLLLGSEAASTQQPVTLHQLLNLAEKNYPLIKSKMMEVQAAEKGVSVSKSTMFPTLDASYQLNYATYNNITGMAYPQYLIPISGPPSASNNMNPVFGSAASLLLNWQPITFGQRISQVNFARAALKYANADAQNEIFQHKIKVIQAYLDVLTASELAKVYTNNLKRTYANLQSIQSLVISGVRPGVDTAIFKAEVSKAKVDLLNSQKNKEQVQVYLSQLLASDNNITLSDTTYFSKLPSNRLSSDSVNYPLVNLYNSNVAIGVARRKVLAKTMMPTLGVWGITFARGSGVSYHGTVDSPDGLNFQRNNFGIGMQLSIPLMQPLRIHPQLQQQTYMIQSNREKLKEIELSLKKQNELADTSCNNAIAIVNESPLFLESAQFSYRAMQSRYESGLANIADLLQAQYVLVKAETDCKLAYMNVWKAFLYKAAVSGDLDAFINQVK